MFHGPQGGKGLLLCVNKVKSVWLEDNGAVMEGEDHLDHIHHGQEFMFHSEFSGKSLKA